jgi:hypothetical protein
MLVEEYIIAECRTVCPLTPKQKGKSFVKGDSSFSGVSSFFFRYSITHSSSLPMTANLKQAGKEVS